MQSPQTGMTGCSHFAGGKHGGMRGRWRGAQRGSREERSCKCDVLPAGCPQPCLPGTGSEVGGHKELCAWVAGVWDALHGAPCF